MVCFSLLIKITTLHGKSSRDALCILKSVFSNGLVLSKGEKERPANGIRLQKGRYKNSLASIDRTNLSPDLGASLPEDKSRYL